MKSMTKKITATALFGVLAVSAFAGCGGASSSSNGSSNAGSDAAKFDASKTISVVTKKRFRHKRCFHRAYRRSCKGWRQQDRQHNYFGCNNQQHRGCYHKC